MYKHTGEDTEVNQLALTSFFLGIIGILSFILWLNVRPATAFFSDLLFPTPAAMGFFLGCFGWFDRKKKYRYLILPGIVLSLIPFVWWFWTLKTLE